MSLEVIMRRDLRLLIKDWQDVNFLLLAERQLPCLSPASRSTPVLGEES